MQATTVESEGVSFVEVTDPKTGKSFRFYDFEHTVAQALDGRPLDVVAVALKENAGLELTADQLAAFADQLEALGFLETAENGADRFFPPLTAEETGNFERPRILAEGGATAEILRELGVATPPPAEISELPAPVQAAPEARAPEARTPEPRTPEPEPLGDPVRSGQPELDLDLEPDLPGVRDRDLPPRPAAAPPAYRSFNGNGAHAAGELQASMSGTLSAPPAPPPPPKRPTPVSAGPAVAESRRESLRLVPPPPLALETPPPSRPDPILQAHAQAEPEPETPPPEAESLFDQPVHNTGSPSFPPPIPEDAEEGRPQRLELSMTRRFITPERGRPAGRRVWLAYAAMGVLAAGIVFVMAYRFFAASEPPPVSVRVVVPSPSSVYRWWDATATVQQTGGAPLSIPRDGKVAEIIPAGTRFAVGDVLVMLESARPFRAALNHNKSRLAYYEQMRETMTQQDNRPKLRDAELKIAEKKRLITEAQEAFGNHAVVAAQPGEVAEALVNKGAPVKAGEPALRLKSSGYRAMFELPRADADKARQLGFCRIEIEGKPLDCSLAAEGGDETHVAIELPNDPSLVGKTVRLARDRLDAVFSVPTSALVRVGESDRLFVVPPSGRAEMRVVAVADRGPTGATITQGLDVGDRVITDVPPGLRPDARVLISGTTSQR
jgi:hypothetical protein